MTMTTISPIAWSMVAFGFLLVTQRVFQRQLQTFLVGLTRDANVTLAVYALLFVPGVALHELSHWLAAWCLRVRTISFSLMPKRARGDQLRLGYVETEKADPLRSALIGAAPLLSGVALLSVLTLNQLALEPIVEAAIRFDAQGVLRTFAMMWKVPDVGLWLYLVVAISNTMLPSAADRSAWLPAGAIALTLGLIAAWAGLDARNASWLSGLTQAFLPRLSTVFGLTGCLNLALGMLFMGVGKILLRARHAALE